MAAEAFGMNTVVNNLENIHMVWANANPTVHVFAQIVAKRLTEMKNFREKICSPDEAELIQPMDFVSQLDLTMKFLKASDKEFANDEAHYGHISNSLFRLTCKTIPKSNGKMETLKILRRMKRIKHGPFVRR